MTKRLCFLLGILVGQLLMTPYTYYLVKTPRIEALTISDIYYDHLTTQHFEIADIPKGYVLKINIASFDTVNAEYQKLDPGGPLINGFYNDRTNVIWCVYDPLVLYHEIKHATEGFYHR